MFLEGPEIVPAACLHHYRREYARLNGESPPCAPEVVSGEIPPAFIAGLGFKRLSRRESTAVGFAEWC